MKEKLKRVKERENELEGKRKKNNLVEKIAVLKVIKK